MSCDLVRRITHVLFNFVKQKHHDPGNLLKSRLWSHARSRRTCARVFSAWRHCLRNWVTSYRAVASAVASRQASKCPGDKFSSWYFVGHTPCSEKRAWITDSAANVAGQAWLFLDSISGSVIYNHFCGENILRCSTVSAGLEFIGIYLILCSFTYNEIRAYWRDEWSRSYKRLSVSRVA